MNTLRKIILMTTLFTLGTFSYASEEFTDRPVVVERSFQLDLSECESSWTAIADWGVVGYYRERMWVEKGTCYMPIPESKEWQVETLGSLNNFSDTIGNSSISFKLEYPNKRYKVEYMRTYKTKPVTPEVPVVGDIARSGLNYLKTLKAVLNNDKRLHMTLIKD